MVETTEGRDAEVARIAAVLRKQPQYDGHLTAQIEAHAAALYGAGLRSTSRDNDSDVWIGYELGKRSGREVREAIEALVAEVRDDHRCGDPDCSLLALAGHALAILDRSSEAAPTGDVDPNPDPMERAEWGPEVEAAPTPQAIHARLAGSVAAPPDFDVVAATRLEASEASPNFTTPIEAMADTLNAWSASEAVPTHDREACDHECHTDPEIDEGSCDGCTGTSEQERSVTAYVPITLIDPATGHPASEAAPAVPACCCDWPGCQGQCHTGSSCPCHVDELDVERLAQAVWAVYPFPGSKPIRADIARIAAEYNRAGPCNHDGIEDASACPKAPQNAPVPITEAVLTDILASHLGPGGTIVPPLTGTDTDADAIRLMTPAEFARDILAAGAAAYIRLFRGQS